MLSNRLFTALYTLLTALAWLAALPAVALAALRPKYRRSLPSRFFLWRNPPFKEGGLWFHACSFGEVRALAPLLRRFPDSAVSVVTHTGYDEARKWTDRVRFLPFEPLLWGWIRPQKALVVVEAELWYLLFYLARGRGARTILLNARISDRSYPRYRRFAWYYRRLFAYVDRVYAQSEEDAVRLKALGAADVRVIGNIKLAELPKPTRHYRRPEGLVVTAASTHEGEEALIFDAFLALRAERADTRLIVVPRHPERFEKVARMLARKAEKVGLRLARWSKEGAASLEADVALVDAMGELVNLYAISDIVVLGGAFAPVGGHNPAEVLPFGCRLITGRHIFNQKEMFASLEGAIFCDPQGLPDALRKAAEAPPLRQKRRVRLSALLKELEDVVS